MGSVPNQFSITVRTKPQKAHAELSARLKTKSLAEVARHYGVHRHTITNWIAYLVKQGFADPRFADGRNPAGIRPGTPGAYPRGGV